MVGMIVSVYAGCALTGNSLDLKYFGTPELKQWEWLTFLGIAIGILGFGVSFFAICIRPFYARQTVVEFLNKLGGTHSASKAPTKLIDRMGWFWFSLGYPEDKGNKDHNFKGIDPNPDKNISSNLVIQRSFVQWNLRWKSRWMVWFLPVVIALFFKLSFIHNSIKVQGVVTKIIQQYRPSGNGADYPEVTFSNPNNQSVSYTTSPVITGGPCESKIGDKMEVYFYPQDPSQSRINSFIQMWSLTSFLIIFSVFFILWGWWPHWVHRNKLIIKSPVEIKKIRDAVESIMFYKASTPKKIGFGFLFLVFPVLFSIFSYFLGPRHDTDWKLSVLMEACMLVFYTFGFQYLIIFEKGFIYCRNPLWPVYQLAWDEIKNVEYKKTKLGLDALIFITEKGKLAMVPNFTLFENLTEEQFISLIRENTHDSVLDQSVLNWLGGNND